MNKITYWKFSKEGLRETAIDMRDKSSVNHHKKIFSNENIFQMWVYGFRYDCLKLSEKIIGQEIHGTVLEIGAGTGINSCIVSKNVSVEKVYVLDYSKVCVEELITFVIEKFGLLENEKKKLYPIVGSFNDIKLPNNSIDYILAMGALHHSEDREITLNEIYRVLKLGGYLIACERANLNTLTNKNLNLQLDKEYDIDFKIRMGYDPSKKYTRRMNSEHKPILAEWEYLLTKTGFRSYIFWFLKFQKISNLKIIHLVWNIFGKAFFRLFGNMMVKRKLTNVLQIKIPYYPWFSKSKDIDDILIISKKEKYMKMP